MMQDINTYDNGLTKMLLQKYFDATISPLEMDRLEAIASGFVSGKLSCPDKETADSLRLINSISRYAESSLDEFAQSLPSGLEDRLSAHISMLAAKDRSCSKRSWVKRAVSYSAAAAIAALLVAAGYHYMTTSEDILPPYSILIADAPKEETADHKEGMADHLSENKEIAPIHEQLTSPKHTAIAQTAPALGISTTTSNKRNQTTTPGNQRKQTVAKATEATPHSANVSLADTYISEADEALSTIPDFPKDALALSEEAFRVMPTGVAAYVETSQLLVQPISTLSQSINGIYESVGIVSEALSGVSTALQAVNYSLALLADPL